MAVELLSGALPMINGTRSNPSGHNTKKKEYKLKKVRLENLDSTIIELPQCFAEWLGSLNNYCNSGIKLASLLETVLEDTPLLMTASQYKEGSEKLKEKCKRLELHIQPEFVAACKKVGPCVSQLRGSISTHAKSLTKYETAQTQYENINSDSASKARLDQAETKFKNALQDFANQDRHLAEVTEQLDKLRVEAMGSCFLSMLEAQASLLSSAVDIMGPLGSYKEIGQSLIDTKTTSVIKEATLGWLAAAQVYRSLRTFGSLSRNDIQCMMFSGSDGLPDTVGKGLNNKVDQLLKMYSTELDKTVGTPRIVPGGFHTNPKGIELALKDCCSELEAVGAGAQHVMDKHDKQDQINRDIPRTMYHIGGKKLDVAYGRNVDQNIREKLTCIEELISNFPLVKKEMVEAEKVAEFAFHVLNETCTTVTNTSAKTAVQLVYGKANLVLVRASPNPDDFVPVEISSKGDSSLVISVHSSWWLVEDYSILTHLCRLPDPNSYIGLITSNYTIELSLANFIDANYEPELPTISVECTRVCPEYFSSIEYNSTYHPDPPQRSKSKSLRSKTKRLGHSIHSYLHHHGNDEERNRLPSSEGEGQTDGSGHYSSHGNSPLDGHVSRGYGGMSRSGKTNLTKTPSMESISTVTSGVTLKAVQAYEEDILADLIRNDGCRRGLTEATLKSLSSSRRYSKLRKDPHSSSNVSRNEDRKEQWEGSTHAERSGKRDQFSGKPSGEYPPGTNQEFPSMYDNYLDSQYHHYYKNMADKDTFEEDDPDNMLPSQDPNDGGNPSISGGGNSLSVDSGISVMQPRNANGDRINGGRPSRDDSVNDEAFGSYLIKRSLGPFMPPVSSDSESDSPSGGGRDSRTMDMFGGGAYRTGSQDDLPNRSSSSASSHGGHTHMGGGSKVMDGGDSLSLPDKMEYGHGPVPFNQAPGSQRMGHHQRHSSLSLNPADFIEPLSQDPYDNNPFSQEAPLPLRRDDSEYHRPGGGYSGPTGYDPRGNQRSQYGPHFGSDPYPNPSPNYMPNRQSRSLKRTMLPPQEDYPMMRHPQGPVPIPPGPGPYWDGYQGGHHMHRPPLPAPPPHHMGHPPGPPPRPMHPDMPYHIPPGYRSTTPDSSSSLSSISPAPSPHPTPPTTPPPHHPNQMIPPPMPSPGPMRLPPPQRMPRPMMPPPMDFPPDFRMQPPMQRMPPPPPTHHNGPHPHMGPPPPHHQIHHHMPMSGPHPDWERWKRHP